jgi:hypothetical protein
MRWLILLVSVFTLAACSEVNLTVESESGSLVEKDMKVEGQSGQADLPDLGLAPELENEIWLNTDQPLRLSELGGSVVLLDMWTFG